MIKTTSLSHRKSIFGQTAKTLLLSCVTMALTQTANAYVYVCEKNDSACVPNYNANAIKENEGIKTYNLVRVSMVDGVTRDLSAIKSSARWLDQFFETASRGQLRTRLNQATTVELDKMSCKEAKSALPDYRDQFYTIRVFPWVDKIKMENHKPVTKHLPLCGSSNAGDGKANLVGVLKRDFAHEVGHLLGLKHGHRIDKATGAFFEYGDSTSIMGDSGAYNYSLPQLHWLGWTQKNDIVQLDTATLNNGGTLEVTLRPTDKNTVSNSPTPMGYVYDLSPDRRLFISIPQSAPSGNNGNIPAGRIAFYSAPKCKGCRGMAMDDTLVDSIYNPKESKDYKIQGLIVNPVRYESHFVQENGHKEERVSSVTLRISKAP